MKKTLTENIECGSYYDRQNNSDGDLVHFVKCIKHNLTVPFIENVNNKFNDHVLEIMNKTLLIACKNKESYLK